MSTKKRSGAVQQERPLQRISNLERLNAIQDRRLRNTLRSKQLRQGVAALRQLMREAEERTIREEEAQDTLALIRKGEHYRKVLKSGNGHRREVLRRMQLSEHRDFLIGIVADNLAEERLIAREMLSA